MEADLSQPPPSSSPARTTQPSTRPSAKRAATAASTVQDERTRRKKEWDQHGADLTWNWVDEQDMKVLAEVSLLQRAEAGNEWGWASVKEQGAGSAGAAEVQGGS